MTLPDFLLVGPLKTGTSSLIQALLQHPKISAGRNIDVLKGPIKEPRHFDNFSFDDWDLEGYKKLFATVPEDNICFEATPHYFANAKARARIRLCLPQAKVIMTLRNPVKRFISNLSINIAARLIYQNPKLTEEYLKGRPWLIGKDLWQGEQRSIDQIFAEMRDHRSEKLPMAYFSQGEYIRHLKAWYNAIPPEQIKIVFFEELLAKPDPIFSELLHFLGIDSKPLALGHVNSGEDWAKWARADIKNHFTAEHIAFLEEYYEPFNRLLARELGRELPW